MLKKSTLIIALIWHFFIFSQHTCTSEDPLMDMNSITKCSIPKKSKSKHSNIRVRVSSRRRYHKKGMNKLRLYKSKSNKLKGILAQKATKKQKTTKVQKTVKTKQKKENIQSPFESFPYEIVDIKPNFNKCSTLSPEQQNKCFRKQLLKHIMMNFRYPKKAYLAGIQGRVIVQFVINEQGNISKVISRGPIEGKELEEEAKRIIKTLPKFPIVGQVEGQKVRTICNFPIVFTIPGIETVKKIAKSTPLKDIVDFGDTDEIPLFKECINEKDKNKCFNNKLSEHITANFAYPTKAVSQGIEGKIDVSFIINKHGDIANVEVTGTESKKAILEEEAKRLVMRLPNLIPGKRKSKPVNVRYSLPINFVLE